MYSRGTWEDVPHSRLVLSVAPSISSAIHCSMHRAMARLNGDGRVADEATIR
jgi:hypothetical protein